MPGGPGSEPVTAVAAPLNPITARLQGAPVTGRQRPLISRLGGHDQLASLGDGRDRGEDRCLQGPLEVAPGDAGDLLVLLPGKGVAGDPCLIFSVINARGELVPERPPGLAVSGPHDGLADLDSERHRALSGHAIVVRWDGEMGALVMR